MIVYQSTKDGFLDDVLKNQIQDKIHQAYFRQLGRSTSPNEILSWKQSMLYMNNVLNDDQIPDDANISIEFQIPLTSKRIDFIIAGLDEEKKENVVIIELKQWSSAELTEKDAIVTTRFQHGITETAHPSYQAWTYAALLEEYNQTVQDEDINLIPCAYLHNYELDNTINNPFYESHINKAPLFLKSDALKLRDFIKKYVRYGDCNQILYRIDNGRIRPSKQLADSMASMLKGNKEFFLLDDQKIVYESAIEIANKSTVKNKQVLIVEGGPGTGKSVVAVNLLVELTKQGLVTRYVSKNAAPRAVYSTKLSGTTTKGVINNLFGGTGSYYESKSNEFDAMIVDEAHRLNFKSGLYQNLGVNQALELINVSKFTIFFVDDDQRVHIKDIGTKRQLEIWAKQNDAQVHHLELNSQFRCNGADGYISWLDNTLQKKETANIKLSRSDFDFRVFDNPKELQKAIEEKNRVNNKSRLVAGYCWDWISKKQTQAYDIEFPEFDFHMQWNLTKDGSAWIIGKDSIKEIGCIHTCQGLELDYVGVVVGNDLRYKGGKVVTDVLQRSVNDNSIRGIKKMIKEDPDSAFALADRIIKNTYRTLFTRGMKGCYVYFCDEALANYFRERIDEVSVEEEFEIDDQNTEHRIEPIVNDDVKYIDYLPLYTVKAACGAFGNYEVVEEQGWVNVEGLGRLNRGMFVVKATGHSMEPKIKDGDLCVFRRNVVGSRSGKILLVQHNDHYDSDNSGSYSIKKYSSEKITDPKTGEWQHSQIKLIPLNTNYETIIIENDDSFMVIGEFVGVV